jgi:hypothetical protein
MISIRFSTIASTIRAFLFLHAIRERLSFL